MTYPTLLECALVAVVELLLAHRKYVGTVRIAVMDLGAVAFGIRNPMHRKILSQFLCGTEKDRKRERETERYDVMHDWQLGHRLTSRRLYSIELHAMR